MEINSFSEALKDESLDRIATTSNVAQYISYDARLNQRYSRVTGFPPNHVFSTYQEGIWHLLSNCPDGTVNIRTFDAESSRGNEFAYGNDYKTTIETLRKLAGKGLHTIVNETVSIFDGGVSGVILNDIIEFAPEDTPRCVDKPGIASMDRRFGVKLLETVYGFNLPLDFPKDIRVEFSIHPARRGVRSQHTIIWEETRNEFTKSLPILSWPNKFSRFIGDKAYGLLVAHTLGFPVPKTTVISRHVPPFTFGKSTGTGEIWIRTCPKVKHPGEFTTLPHWIDPFILLQNEDPEGDKLSSILAQEGVEPEYSGALNTVENGKPFIQGVKGKGDDYMIGKKSPDKLPVKIDQVIQKLFYSVKDIFGPVRIEWVYDGHRVWIVQFHQGITSTNIADVIFEGKAEQYHRFETKRGLPEFRIFFEDFLVKYKNHGIILVGNVGITSHFGELLSDNGIPSIIEYEHDGNQLEMVFDQ